MTREEENREKEITIAAESEYFVTKAEEFAWIHGAEWADQHPRKGLWDGDRVIAWLKENIGEYYIYEDLKKEMED
jgi:predicted nucleotidyltransferase